MEEDETAPQIVELRDPGATRPERAPDQPAEPSDSGEAAAEDREESRDGADGNDGAGDPGAGNAVERPRPERVRDANIYYIRVTDDGKIHPHQVERQVSYDNSPMTRTLQVLIDGPTMEELNLGLLNLIPKDTRLLSARVENGTAYLNFNESFRFNSMGVEGYLAQLQQIVFAATEFDTVERVQILIDGQRREYLGGEGVYIGEPLTRESFS
jgi:spore germination protein GerM